jgi:hypothetical protein
MDKILKTDKHPVILKYFLLPLYDIYSKVIEDKFLNAYINSDKSLLFLELKEEHNFDDNALYQGKCKIGTREFYLFGTCSSVSIDIERVIKGQYSKLSKFSKSKIITNSGLEYLKVKKDGVYTSYPLMALFKEKFPEWKAIIEKYLSVSNRVSIPEELELLSKLDVSKVFIEDIEKAM